jgi:hypothetical protein
MSDIKSGPPTTKIRLIIVCLLMIISTVLAAIDIYTRLNPPKVEIGQTEPAQENHAPLRSGTNP